MKNRKKSLGGKKVPQISPFQSNFLHCSDVGIFYPVLGCKCLAISCLRGGRAPYCGVNILTCLILHYQRDVTEHGSWEKMPTISSWEPTGGSSSTPWDPSTPTSLLFLPHNYPISQLLPIKLCISKPYSTFRKIKGLQLTGFTFPRGQYILITELDSWGLRPKKDIKAFILNSCSRSQE